VSHGSLTPRWKVLARSAFISRREGRYIFAIRTPARLKSVFRSGSIRLAVEPIRDEDDCIERSAFQAIAFDVQFLVRHSPGPETSFLLTADEMSAELSSPWRPSTFAAI
jgi:hypothetical protein